MTKEEFIKVHCETSKTTQEEILKDMVVLPCKCNYVKCKGWAVVSNDERSIKVHNELYGKNI